MIQDAPILKAPYHGTEMASAVAVCSDLDQAEDAIDRLIRHGFPREQISLVAGSIEDDSELHKYLNFGDRSETNAGMGALVGGIFGAISGTTFLWIPDLGTVPIPGVIVIAMTGFVVGALVGAMIGWGIPKNQVADYEAKLEAGKVLVIARGATEEVDDAYGALKEGDCDDVWMHAQTSVDSPEIDDSPLARTN